MPTKLQLLFDRRQAADLMADLDDGTEVCRISYGFEMSSQIFGPSNSKEKGDERSNDVNNYVFHLHFYIIY